jgi:hypothetical protein
MSLSYACWLKPFRSMGRQVNVPIAAGRPDISPSTPRPVKGAELLRRLTLSRTHASEIC